MTAVTDGHISRPLQSSSRRQLLLLEALHSDPCPHRRSTADIEAIFPHQARRTDHVLERHIDCARLVRLVQKRDSEATWVCNHVRGDGDPERLVEGRIEDIRAWGVCLDSSLEALCAPCNLHAGLKLVALTLKAEDAGDQNCGKPADRVLRGAALSGQEVCVGDEIVELGVDRELGIGSFALVSEG